MREKLIKYSGILRQAVKEEIDSILSLDSDIKDYLNRSFCYYSPNKERAYIVNSITRHYCLNSKLSYYLESGLEIIFAAYYLRDDLIDKQPKILGETINELTSRKFSIISDILSEIGNNQIAKYCNQLKGALDEFVFTGFQSLSYGQLLGLNNGYMIGIDDYLEIAYHKNGAMMEYAIKMLQPIFPEKKDLDILIDFAKNFGIASQIRNDIEDFLIDKQFGEPLQDLKNNQANFVLSLYIDSLENDLDNHFCILERKNSKQDEILSILSHTIVLSINILQTVNHIIKLNLNSLSHDYCANRLKQITDELIRII